METKVSGSCGGNEHLMTAGSSATTESSSKCTIFMSTDGSREKGLLRSSDDEESRCERFIVLSCL
jgi:hypothetical protein